MSEDGAIKVSKLIGSSNYKLWAIRVKAALITKELWGFYSRTDDPSAKGLKEDVKALSYIQLACADGPLLYISAIKNSTNTWA